jgi:hypothetical protein
MEWTFADDVDIHHNLQDEELNEFLDMVKDNLALKWGLTLNVAKTERFALSGDRKDRMGVKKLGAMLDGHEQVVYVRRKAQEVFRALWPLWWKGNVLPLEVKMKVYNACVLPILTHEMAIYVLTKSDLRALEATHRRHLRTLIGIHYPRIISNVALYRCSKQRRLGTYIIKQRKHRNT